MKNILYIGNKLNNKRSNLSSIDTLGLFLEKEGYMLFYSSSKSYMLLRLMDMLFACIRYRNRVDIVIIDTYSTYNFYYALLVSQLCRLLHLNYIPSLNGGNLPNRLKKYPILSQFIFKHAYNLLSPSLYLKDTFKDYGYEDVVYIPNTIDLDQYQLAKRTYHQVNLLWVRSFSKIYNPSLAVRVLKALQDDNIEANLCMVGPDSDGTLQYVKVLANELQVDVKFTGKLTKVEWIAMSKYYNVFINTTTIDNTPVSVIEAMALGLPIVSTNVGGMPYLIQHGIHGLLVESNDVDSMVAAVLSLFEQPEKREQMILNARKLAESFNWERVKRKWMEVLG